MTVPTDVGGPVRLSRLPRRGLLLGHTAGQLAVLAAGLTVLVAGLYTGGGRGVVWTAPVWTAAMLLAWVPVAGRPLVSWAPTASVWAWRSMGRQRTWRRQVCTPRPDGALGLPGDIASLRQFTDARTGAVMVHDPHQGRLVAVAAVSHRSFVLLDAAEQHRRVHGWARVLATVCRSNRIARLQVLERTLAGSGTGLSRWWTDHGTVTGWPARTYASLIDRAGPAAERHVTLIAIALDLQAAARPIRTAGGGLRGAAAVLSQEMTTVGTALAAADLAPVRWLTATALADVVRSAYDPQAISRADRDHAEDARWPEAGPMGIDETWSGLRSDSAHHAVLWVSQWPHGTVTPSFLSPLLLATGVTRAFTLLCDPVPADRAARDLRRRRTEHLADAAQRARIGQLDDPDQTAEYHDVLQQQADLTAGHGLLRYTGLLAVTAPTSEALEEAVAQIEQAAVQASCETRRLVGQQAQAFAAAALPVCRGI